MSIFLISTALLLDGIIALYIPLDSMLLPLTTVTTLFIIYPLFKKKEKKYFITIIITGIIYDLLYTNLLFFNAIIFYAIGNLVKYIYKNFNQNIIKTIIYITIIIIAYELLMGTILYTFRVIPVTFEKLIYKISHSLLTNIIYAVVIYLSFQKRLLKN